MHTDFRPGSSSFSSESKFPTSYSAVGFANPIMISKLRMRAKAVHSNWVGRLRSSSKSLNRQRDIPAKSPNFSWSSCFSIRFARMMSPIVFRVSVRLSLICDLWEYGCAMYGLCVVQNPTVVSLWERGKSAPPQTSPSRWTGYIFT
jgi:hypothetical protein